MTEFFISKIATMDTFWLVFILEIFAILGGIWQCWETKFNGKAFMLMVVSVIALVASWSFFNEMVLSQFDYNVFSIISNAIMSVMDTGNKAFTFADAWQAANPVFTYINLGILAIDCALYAVIWQKM